MSGAQGTSIPNFNQYDCHKRVLAAEIVDVLVSKSGPQGTHLLVVKAKDGTVTMAQTSEPAMMTRASPGDFFIWYDEAYASVSPRDKFLDGYTLVADPEPPAPSDLVPETQPAE